MARILITSAIPYINGIKHLETLWAASCPPIFTARYMRGGGTRCCSCAPPTSMGRLRNSPRPRPARSVEDYCARMWGVQAELAKGFRLSFDHFWRSSSPQNRRLTQYFAARLDAAGLIAEVSEKQMYSNADGRFLPDRYIEGTCPNCGYDRARGDQCENCTKQLTRPT